MTFLTAEWRKLAFANYRVNPELLQPFVPHGTELDTYEGHCYVSLIGFMFQQVRVLGIPVPWHTDFEEVNLRFYVRRFDAGEWKRGVVFIKEIVPLPAVTFVANLLYGEAYEAVPMRHLWTLNGRGRGVQYHWLKQGKWNRFEVDAEVDSVPITPGSEMEFITEHYWGYARVSERKTNEYEVTHPVWRAYPVTECRIEVDFGAVYGKRFAFLAQEEPSSVMLAEGSAIAVKGMRALAEPG